MNTFISYCFGTLLLWWIYFWDYAIVSIAVSFGLFYLISEYFDNISQYVKLYSNILEHILSIICSISIIVLSIQWYLNNSLSSIYLIIGIVALFCSAHLLLFGDIRRLIYYPFFWLFVWLSIIWILWYIGWTFMDRYAIISLEKARIQDAKLNTTSNWHPPLMGPQIVSDPVDSALLQ